MTAIDFWRLPNGLYCGNVGSDRRRRRAVDQGVRNLWRGRDIGGTASLLVGSLSRPRELVHLESRSGVEDGV